VIWTFTAKNKHASNAHAADMNTNVLATVVRALDTYCIIKFH